MRYDQEKLRVKSPSLSIYFMRAERRGRNRVWQENTRETILNILTPNFEVLSMVLAA